MGHSVTLGGERIGSGNKQKVHLHGYERSTHDLSFAWRSTMAAGTLVPWEVQVGLPGDTFDYELNADVQTHPTSGPLFGSFKLQLDMYQCPLRLYQAQLHNNKLNIGLNMANVKLPLMRLTAQITPTLTTVDFDNSQINPSCILAYLGVRGVGVITGPDPAVTTRTFNAVPLLGYWDIYKNYYSNKQEEIGAVIHTELPEPTETVDSIEVSTNGGAPQGLSQAPDQDEITIGWSFTETTVTINWTIPGPPPVPSEIILNTDRGQFAFTELMSTIFDNLAGQIIGTYNKAKYGVIQLNSWEYISVTKLPAIPPSVSTFDLTNIDDMREYILLGANLGNVPIVINDATLTPYSWVLDTVPGSTPVRTNMLNTQEGLAVKTYQSDLFNNWLQTEWIDGTNGISAITAIDTSGGSFTIDTLNLSKKVYDMLNRIAVSGGTYDDWLDSVYDHDRIIRAETPIYHGGLSKELVFQEVVSNSQSVTEEGAQPLGTLGGRGRMSDKHKGGHVTIKIDEPSMIIGIVSLTPRIDYSQGNAWYMHLKTMDDLHKPQLDQIGFQELITEQMAWWATKWNSVNGWVQTSAGKQPAWINYMTNFSKTYGNFAIENNEMFMTLNRRYELDRVNIEIQDLTTYIDPAKFNFIFAQTSLDAQNFWVQIGVKCTARRKISAKVMPNL